MLNLSGMSFGERLLSAIKAAGLTQTAFGERMNVTAAAVSGWVSDKHGMSADHIKRAAKVLSVDVETIAGWVHESLLEELGVAKPTKRK